jgi:putative peptidoglycan lipid II flippase
LNVAFRFTQLPIGLFGVAVGVVALPAVSRSVARGDTADFNGIVTRALQLVFALTVPAAVGLAALAPEVIGLVYQYGRFTAHDTAMAAQALIAYSLGLAGYANIKVLVPAFYALGDARTPALVSLLSVVVNATLNWIAIRRLGFGHAALALATSLVALLNFAILFLLLRGRIGPFRGLGPAVARIVAASVGVALACALSRAVVGGMLAGDSVGARSAVVATGVVLGVGTYVMCASWLGVREIGALLGRIRALLFGKGAA